MHSFSSPWIMPKETRAPVSGHASVATAPYPTNSSTGPRNGAIWTSMDDEALMRARASGLNWQPIANRYFPNKTPNACRKRHERLMERRQVEDWDEQKLELLAQEYLAARKEMWEILASRVGEKWAVVEAKCMEKGLKTLQTTARSAQRRAAAAAGQGDLFDDPQGIADHYSDSGIGLGSDAEMEVDGDGAGPSHQNSSLPHASNPLPPTPAWAQQVHSDRSRSHSLPQLLPLYQPPPPVRRPHATATPSPAMHPATTVSCEPPHLTTLHRHSPTSQNGRGGISIQAVLAPADTQDL